MRKLNMRNMNCLVYFVFLLPVSSTEDPLNCTLVNGVNLAVGVLNVKWEGVTYTIVDKPDQPFTNNTATAACKQMGYIDYINYESITSYGDAMGPIASINCLTTNISTCELRPISDENSCANCFRKASIVLRCYKEKTTVFEKDTRPTECILNGLVKTYFNGTFRYSCMYRNDYLPVTNDAVCINEGLTPFKYRPQPNFTVRIWEFLECKNTNIEDCQWKETNDKKKCGYIIVECKFNQSDVKRAEFCRNGSGTYHQAKVRLRHCLDQCPSEVSEIVQPTSACGRYTLSAGLYTIITGLIVVVVTAI